MLRFALSTLVCIVAMAGTAVADDKKDAMDLVEKAIAYTKANGRQKGLAEINTLKGSFDKGEMYVFAYDTTGVVLAHPKNPKLLGKNMVDMPDVDGKYFRKDILALAKKQGFGWVDYKYKNPESNQVEEKTTYFKTSDGIVFLCGVYK